jgi:hypothetical protein
MRSPDREKSGGAETIRGPAPVLLATMREAGGAAVDGTGDEMFFQWDDTDGDGRTDLQFTDSDRDGAADTMLMDYSGGRYGGSPGRAG